MSGGNNIEAAARDARRKQADEFLAIKPVKASDEKPLLISKRKKQRKSFHKR